MPENNEQRKIIVGIGADNTQLNETVDQSKKKLGELGNVEVTPKSIKSLSTQLREATDQAVALQQAGKDNTQEYRNLVKQIAGLKDEQVKLNNTIGAFDPGNKLGAFVGISKSAAIGVQGVAGAMAALGVNSDVTLESIQKLQGIMAFTDAIGSIGDLQDNWKGFLLMLGRGKKAYNDVTVAQDVYSDEVDPLFRSMLTP